MNLAMLAVGADRGHVSRIGYPTPIQSTLDQSR
jgi:hypothetical protein